MKWDYSNILLWNDTIKYCSAACAGFLLMSYDDIGGGGYQTA